MPDANSDPAKHASKPLVDLVRHLSFLGHGRRVT
jgi:hypothetical protein